MVENSGSGTGDYTVTDVIHERRAEAKDYDHKHPAYSRFTQAVVWKSTKGVGRAIADCLSSRVRTLSPTFIRRSDFADPIQKFVVWEYSPRGNVRGEFRFAPYLRSTESSDSHAFIFSLPVKMFGCEAKATVF